MSRVFCEIVAGRLPAWRVLDGESGVGFLDVRPLFPGHTLWVPREHCETFIDLPPSQVGPFFTHAQRLAKAMETALGAHGTFVAMNNRVSQSVAHLHVHVVPRHRKDGLKGFFWPRKVYGPGEAEAVAATLRAALGSGNERGVPPAP